MIFRKYIITCKYEHNGDIVGWGSRRDPYCLGIAQAIRPLGGAGCVHHRRTYCGDGEINDSMQTDASRMLAFFVVLKRVRKLIFYRLRSIIDSWKIKII